MGLVFATTFGLIVWIVLWAIGVKSFDAFLLTLFIIVLAAAGRILAPFLPGKQRDS
jgi:hypothetical protein